MKDIYLIIIVCLLVSCNSQKNEKAENPISDEIDTKKLVLPVIGTFELTATKIDSLNEYGAGDCWGKIRKYSLSNIKLAIDSMICGEYGYTYTYYLLNTKDFIQAVYIKKSESILNLESDSYYYVQQEKIIDFNSDSDSVTSMTRTDTIYDYKLREHDINKKFITQILKDRPAIYKYFDTKYQAAWNMDLDY